MKNYKKVEMLAKNAPTGSYAAGCAMNTHNPHYSPSGQEGQYSPGTCYDPHNTGWTYSCAECEVYH